MPIFRFLQIGMLGGGQQYVFDQRSRSGVAAASYLFGLSARQSHLVSFPWATSCD